MASQRPSSLQIFNENKQYIYAQVDFDLQQLFPVIENPHSGQHGVECVSAESCSKDPILAELTPLETLDYPSMAFPPQLDDTPLLPTTGVPQLTPDQAAIFMVQPGPMSSTPASNAHVSIKGPPQTSRKAAASQEEGRSFD